MAKQTTLIFIPGAWHRSNYWQPITKALENKGYKCIAPHFAFSDPTEPASPSIKPDVDLLQSIIRSETSAGNNVAIFCHSWGGVPGSACVKGFTRKDPSALTAASQSGGGHVIGLGVMAGFLVGTGESLYTFIPERKTEWWVTNDANGRVELNSPIPQTAKERFYHDLPADDQDRSVDVLGKQSAGAYADTENTYSGFLDCAVWYLATKDDRALPYEFQQAILNNVKEQGADVTVRTLDCGHSVMLAKTKETVQFVEDAVEAFLAADK